MEHDLKSILKAIPLFKTLDADELNQFVKLMSTETHPIGDVILVEGDASERLIVVLAGRVAVTKGSGESASHICDLDAGEVIGEVGVLENAPCSANVVAVTEVDAAWISSENLEKYFGSHRLAAIKILRQLVSILADRLRRTNVSYSSLMSIAESLD